MNRIPRFHYPTEREIEQKRIVEQAAAAIAMQAPGAADFQQAAAKLDRASAHPKNSSRRIQ